MWVELLKKNENSKIIIKKERIMFLEKAGKKLYYEVQGKGEPTLLFVHGWMASSAVWREQVPYFAEKNRVVTFDLTGYGQSGKPDGLAYTPDVWLDDLDAVIEHLNLDKPILVGWSMGGAIGMAYSVSRPEALSKLVTCRTAHHFWWRRPTSSSMQYRRKPRSSLQGHCRTISVPGPAVLWK